MPMQSAFSFLPDWPLTPDAVLWAGLALVVAGLCGEWCWRVWRLPRVTGYSVIGLVAGAMGLNVLPPGLVVDGRLLIDVALGLMLFELGSRFSVRWVRNNPWIVAASLAESLLAFTAVLGALRLFGVPWLTSLVIAGVTMATSPAMIIQLRNELRSEGQVTERLMTLSALNSIYAVIVVKLLSGWSHQAMYGDVLATLLQPLYLIAGSVLLALVLARSCHFVYRRMPDGNEHSFAILFGLVLVAIAIAHLLKLSTVLALLIAGGIIKNASERPALWSPRFGSAGWLLTVILFVLTTLSITWTDVMTGGALAVVLIVVRTAAKTLGVVAFARPSGLDWRKGVALGLSLSPMSALAFVLVDDTYALYPTFDTHLRAIVLSAIVILQLLSPIVVYRALKQVSETNGPDARPSQRTVSGKDHGA